ncbi:MAG: GGDEF domain-containing response regulator [Deltaproteobacteria bacterium]|nr:GGDEF domain-containing response regulator [Deltaproteobacteria bacterium]
MQVRVLIVEDDIIISSMIEEILSGSQGINFVLEHRGSLATALACLSGKEIDIILLDLVLPDSDGFDTYSKIHHEFPEIPIIILTGIDDEELAIKSVQHGAQDYLIKGRVNYDLLVLAIRCAIERHRLLSATNALSLTDPLTGLYNRRGLETVAPQQLKIADRLNKKMFLVFIDLDNFKWINDSLGHKAGDTALINTTESLKKVFRESDIIARIGGDEFVVIGLEEAPLGDGLLAERLKKVTDNRNANDLRPYNISISSGIVHYHPGQPCSFDDLLSRADACMYEDKKKKPRLVPCVK